MNLKAWKKNIDSRLQLVIYLWLALLIVTCAGCARNTGILTSNETYFYIPAGIPFKAALTKQGPVEIIKRDRPTIAVDAGYLAELQEEANDNALFKPWKYTIAEEDNNAKV